LLLNGKILGNVVSDLKERGIQVRKATESHFNQFHPNRNFYVSQTKNTPGKHYGNHAKKART
jgi:hypothetical protein